MQRGRPYLPGPDDPNGAHPTHHHHGSEAHALSTSSQTTPRLSEQQLAEIAALIGDTKAATDGLLTEIAQQVKDRREHDHDRAADWDWYCLNASGWLGDRMPVVLRRLLDAEARVAVLEKALTAAEPYEQNTPCERESGYAEGWNDAIGEIRSAAGGAA